MLDPGAAAFAAIQASASPWTTVRDGVERERGVMPRGCAGAAPVSTVS
jgi:hypothetical protein